MLATPSYQAMTADFQPSFVYRFAPYEVDVAAGQIRKSGRNVRLAGQPLEILILLLERPGVVITREEIHARLWSQDTFVDFENGLNKAINKLRQALNDSAETPKFIETLPRRGYRFLAPVQQEEFRPILATVITAEIPASTECGAEKVEVSPPARSTILKRSLYFSAASLIVMFGWFGLRSSAPRVIKLTPLTNTARVDSYGHVFSDGVRLFFLQRHGNHWELSQMPVSGGTIQPFATPFSNAKIYAISPDASEFVIAPFEVRARLLPLWIMPSVGGTPRRLGEMNATDATFTPDGSQITFSNDDGIFQVGRDGLNLRKLLDAKGMKGGLSWSPDGKELRFEWQEKPLENLKLWSIRPDSSHLHMLFPGWKEVQAECCGRFSRDGKLYAFTGFVASGSRNLYVRREDRDFLWVKNKPVRLDTSPTSLADPNFVLDSHQLIALTGNARSEYVHYDQISRELRNLLAGEHGAWLNVARDMDAAVYRGTSNNLWIGKLDGSQKRELVTGSLSPELPAIQPNGKEVAFGARPEGSMNTKICAISEDGGSVSDVVAESYSVSTPSWSPDGSKLLFAAEPDSPASGVYVLDWKSKERHKVPDSVGYWKSRWSPNGKYIASVTADNTSVGLFDIENKSWTVLLHAGVLSPVVWSADSESLYYQDLVEQDQPVHRLNLKTRQSDTVFACKGLLEGGVIRCGFEDVLPDGSLLLQLTRGDHDVVEVELDIP